MKLFFIINPVSGGIDKSHLPALIHDFCSREGFEYKIFETTWQVFATDTAQHPLPDFVPDVMVAIGGDGTVNYVGNTAMNLQLPIAIIPLGTSNALAKNLGVPAGIHDALRRIVDFKNGLVRTWEIDTLDINGRTCLHVCDIGINAKLMRRYHKWKKRGKLYYFISLMAELFPLKFFGYRIVTAMDKVRGKAFSITITNSRMYGTGAVINPNGKMDDGRFEICIIKPFPLWKFFHITMSLFRNRIHLSRYCRFMSLTSAILENLNDEAVHIDGEPVTLQAEIRVQIKPKSLKVIV